MTNKTYITSRDGTKLCGIWHIPEKQTEKAIVLAHGLTVTKDENGIFIDLADQLMSLGYAVFRFDFRGHGESEGKQEDMTVTGEIKDLTAVTQEVRKNYNKVGLVGASFGGGIAILYASMNKAIQALCLWNPVTDYEHTFLNPLMPWLGDKKEQIKNDLLEKGFAEIGSRKFHMGKKVFEEMKHLRPYEELKKITVPTLLLHGDADTHVPYNDSVLYAPSLTNGKLVTIHDAEHGFQERVEDKRRAIDETLKFFNNNL